MQPLEIPEPALGPKLEWMLLSHQVSQAELIEVLTRKYYLSTYKLAITHLNDPRGANIVARRTLVNAVQRAHTYRIGQGVNGWIEDIAEEICRELLRRRKFKALFPSTLFNLVMQTRGTSSEFVQQEADQLEEAQVQFIIAAVIADLHADSRRRKITRGILLMTFAGLALLLLVALNSTDEANPAGSRVFPTHTQSQVFLGKPSHAPALSSVNQTPLSVDSSPEEIIQSVQAGRESWNNLWADGLVIDYGPRGYRGPAIVQREQLWLQPPENSRVLTGPLNEGKPNKLWVTISGQVVKADQETGDWDRFSGGGLIEYTAFRPLLRPAFAYYPEGRIVILGTEVLAGREAIVLDYFLRSGRHEGRYSIDIQTGIGLRLRRYTDRSLSFLREEWLITEIEFNVEIPPNMFQPSYQRPLRFTSGPMGLVETAQTRVNNILVDGIGGRSLLPRLEPPSNFDPKLQDLSFQFTNITHLGALADIAEVYAGSYYLGSVEFDDPWRLQCSRSSDGRLVAFYAEASRYDENPAPLRWIDLENLHEVNFPIPEVLPTSNLAFSPDNSRLVLAGCTSTSGQDCGLYTVDLKDQSATRLIDLQGASSLVWRPDGQEIAFLGGDDSDREWQIYIIDADSGEVTFKGQVSWEANSYRAPQNVPVSGWDTYFPVSNRDLSDCIAAP